MQDNLDTKHRSTGEMVKYSFGACTESLVLNSVFSFSMLYYTKALGLAPELAGAVVFLATIWDAVTVPIMGQISDNTKSRFGKRYPYMFVGGIVMIVSFFFIWYIPDLFKKDCVIGFIALSATQMLFGYLTVMNIILRTGFTIFVIPYTALGFEICSDYTERSQIQGIRNALNMMANLLGPAMAWTIFFANHSEKVQSTQVIQNYINMGIAFTGASCVSLALLLVFTAKYIKDSRDGITSRGDSTTFLRSIRDIFFDQYARFVFVFTFFVLFGIALVSTLQIYVFDDFMKMSGIQKTIVHGGTMIGMGLGSLCLKYFVGRFDKKRAICIAVTGSVFCEFLLAVLLLTGFLQIGREARSFPIAFAVFAFFHSVYWFGNGILVPMIMSMLADVSEIFKIRTGINRDASFAGMLYLIMKVSIGIAGLVAGYCLNWTGFLVGADVVQTPQSLWWVCVLTFLAGPIISLVSLALILRYPIDKEFVETFRVKATA